MKRTLVKNSAAQVLRAAAALLAAVFVLTGCENAAGSSPSGTIGGAVSTDLPAGDAAAMQLLTGCKWESERTLRFSDDNSFEIRDVLEVNPSNGYPTLISVIEGTYSADGKILSMRREAADGTRMPALLNGNNELEFSGLVMKRKTSGSGDSLTGTWEYSSSMYSEITAVLTITADMFDYYIQEKNNDYSIALISHGTREGNFLQPVESVMLEQAPYELTDTTLTVYWTGKENAGEVFTKESL